MKKMLSMLMAIISVFVLVACGNSKKHEGEAKTPNDSSTQNGKNFEDLIKEFESNGFINVKTEKIEDLIVGWLTKDGEVESVSVGGDTEYKANKWYPNDIEVIIKYHTFKSTEEKPEEEVTVTEEKIEVSYPSENAMRAVVVAFTNYYAMDVFTSDGNNYDETKFHAYSDTTGDPAQYFMYVNSPGTWQGVNENTWHVNNLELKTYAYGSLIKASLDVIFDGENYKIINLNGTGLSNIDISSFENERDLALFFTVSPKLIENNRDNNEVNALDHSQELTKAAAREAFEIYGESVFPYGFECHWLTGVITEEQSYDGSWFFKVEVTITNEYGTKQKVIAEGTINNITKSVEGFNVN